MIKGTYKLIDAIDQRTTVNVAKRLNGVVHYGHLPLLPGKVYELEDDELFLNSLKSLSVTKDSTKPLIEKLESYGVDFKEGSRTCCGGRVTKTVTYNIIEVNQSEDT
ncbi:hypothetical protein NRIC_03870 [Enterococcus florum]|uniref:Uncharacterized protein n=1 Tax=Enterococcus florum TaxID=2480627 RepID=A0A4P5P4Y6_9ENTE|nr:hypothetical protein [Enterococcus florum]GCF92496.1 hypothetical protein NRIC_03870 [Enterococcus florum]